MKPIRVSLVLLGSVLVSVSLAHTESAAMSNKEALANLQGVAPPNVLEGATIMKVGSDGKMKVIREGKNGWTCMDPGGAPLCADKGGMEWINAWQAKGPAPQSAGFIYMLKGDEGASNTDPFAAGETADNNWVKTGPHVMIVGAEAKNMMQAYPRRAKADPTAPYVMWPGTPYEHLMLPVE